MSRKIAVLGANGIVGQELIKELEKDGQIEIVAVSRSFENKKVGKVKYQEGDLLDDNLVHNILKDIDTAYLTVGLDYNSSVWEELWPRIIENTVDSSILNGTKLVFFDNVYSYGFVDGPMKEDSLENPDSRKGRVRKKLHEIISEGESRGLKFIIAKSGEFYGPNVKTSSIYNACIENVIQNKKAYWLGSLKKLRTYTYVPDIARALVILANDKSAVNQIWHLPTDKALSGSEFVSIIESILGKGIKISELGVFMARIIALFNPQLKEVIEMYYQFTNDYIFNSEKFLKTYPDFKVTPYKKGFEEMLNSFDRSK